MPSTPELGYVAAEIWHVEIAAEPDAEEFGAPDGYVAVAGEVAVDLQREQHGGKEQRGPVVPVGMGKDFVHIKGAAVCNDHFLKEPPQHLAQTVHGNAIIEITPPLKLRQQAGGPLDGAGNQLREEADIGQKGHHIARRWQTAPVDIDAVAEGLEGVERDAHRQDEVQQKAVGMAVEEGIGKRLSKEVVVFEKTEDEEVDYYVAPQGPSAELGGAVAVADDQAGEETAQRGEGDKQEKPPVPPAVKKIGCCHNEGILPAQLPPQEPIKNKRYWQKNEEFYRVEQHNKNAKIHFFFEKRSFPRENNAQFVQCSYPLCPHLDSHLYYAYIILYLCLIN